MTKGEVGVWNGPKKDDVIYEQPPNNNDKIINLSNQPATSVMEIGVLTVYYNCIGPSCKYFV